MYKAEEKQLEAANKDGMGCGGGKESLCKNDDGFQTKGVVNK